MPNSRLMRIFAIVVATSLLVTACGAGEPQGQEPARTPTATTPTGTTPAATPSGPIVFSSWGGAYSGAWKLVADQFTAQTGIAVVFDDAPGQHAARYNAQLAAKNVTWDLVEFNYFDYLLFSSRRLLWPFPADFKNRVASVVTKPFLTDDGVSPSGGLDNVLACNTKSAKRCPRTPADFWDVDAFPGPRGMFNGGWLVNPISALLADGVAPKDLFPLDLDRAYRKLDQIRPQIKVWWGSGDQQQQVLRDQEVDMTFGWDGRIQGLIAQGVPVAISYEGAIMVGGNRLAIPATAQNKEGALRFIEFWLTNPELQAQWSGATRYPSTHPEQLKHVPQALAQVLWTNPSYAPQVVIIAEELARMSSEDFDKAKKRWQDWLER